MTDPDSPERLPLVQPVWVAFSVLHDDPLAASFTPVPGWHRFDLLVASPWRLASHPDLGAVYRPRWPCEWLTAAEVYAAARDGRGGWRLAAGREAKT